MARIQRHYTQGVSDRNGQIMTHTSLVSSIRKNHHSTKSRCQKFEEYIEEGSR